MRSLLPERAKVLVCYNTVSLTSALDVNCAAHRIANNAPLHDKCPQDNVEAGELSNAQLETVLYAFQRFNMRLPDGRGAAGRKGRGVRVGVSVQGWRRRQEGGQDVALWNEGRGLEDGLDRWLGRCKGHCTA